MNLENYLTKNIRDRYKSFDLAHAENHFDEVYNAAKKIGMEAYEYGVITEDELISLNIAAAYHDTGRCMGEKDHEKYSAMIVKNDIFLKRILNPKFMENNINIICDTILSHRSSKINNEENASIIKDILYDADKISKYDKYRTLVRVITYNLEYINGRSRDEVFETIKQKFISIRNINNRSEFTEIVYGKYDPNKICFTDDEIEQFITTISIIENNIIF